MLSEKSGGLVRNAVGLLTAVVLGASLLTGGCISAGAEAPPVVTGKLDLKGAQIGMTANEFLDVLQGTPVGAFTRMGGQLVQSLRDGKSVTFQAFDPVTEKATELEQQGNVLDLAKLPNDGNFLASGYVHIFGSTPGNGAQFTAAFLGGKLRFMKIHNTDDIPGSDDPSETHALVDAFTEKFGVAPMLMRQPVDAEEGQPFVFQSQWRDSEDSVLSVIGAVSGARHEIREVTISWKGWAEHMAAMKAELAKRQQGAEDQAKQARKSDL